jgi:hypothetical protein
MQHKEGGKKKDKNKNKPKESIPSFLLVFNP